MIRRASDPAPPLVTIAPVTAGGLVVCLGAGPSLNLADVNAVRGRAAAVIAINDAVRLAPWADVLFATDAKWWRWHGADPLVAGFAGRKLTIDARARAAGLERLRHAGVRGFTREADALFSGHNSGYGAINLAAHLGAGRIALLGYDMHGDHFFGPHPDRTRPPFRACLAALAWLAPVLEAAGIAVVNCTPGSAITYFPMAPLETVLEAAAA